MESVMGHGGGSSSINGTWDVGRRERSRKDERIRKYRRGWSEQRGKQQVREWKRKERYNEGNREVNPHTKTKLSEDILRR